MKKIFLLLAAAVLLLSCDEWKDDLYKIESENVQPVPSVVEEGQLYNMSLDG